MTSRVLQEDDIISKVILSRSMVSLLRRTESTDTCSWVALLERLHNELPVYRHGNVSIFYYRSNGTILPALLLHSSSHTM